MRSNLKPRIYIGLAGAILIFCVYIFSLCPTLYLIDSGELAAASHTLGIAHPTGYPLYMLISYFFAHLPGEPIYNLNLLSALFCALAGIIVFLVAIKFSRNPRVAILVTCLFAFAPMVWRIAVINEVYALTALFIILIFYVGLNIGSTAEFYFLMYIIGLALTNHVIIFAVALPIFLYVLLHHRIKFKKALLGIIFAMLGLSLYFYLISRTAGGAEIAWGNTHNLQRLIWHITGRQYQVWMFSLPLNEITKNLVNAIKMLIRNLCWIFILPLLYGYYLLFKDNKKHFWLLLSIPLLNLGYAVNYSIPDIESYFLPALITFIAVITIGLKNLDKWLKWYIVIPVILLMIVINYKNSTQRGNYFGLEFAYAHLAQLPENSLLICVYWDIYSPIMYLREVKHYREDVIAIDKELLRRTWYIKYIENEYPDLYAKVELKINAFLIELKKFEYGQSYDPNTIQMRYLDMLSAFIQTYENRAFIASPYPDRDLESVLPQYHRLPRGLNFQVLENTDHYCPIDYSEIRIFEPGNINDRRLAFNSNYVMQMIRNNIAYQRSAGQNISLDKAIEWQKRFKKRLSP